jgi:hypothetical protein
MQMNITNHKSQITNHKFQIRYPFAEKSIS